MNFILPDNNEQDQIEYIHDAILEHFKGSNALAREWFETENYFLRGETPIKNIRSGNIVEVVKAAKKLLNGE